MHWKSFVSLAFVITNVLAMIRFECSQLVIQRFDPLLNPGIVSPHLHQIVGGNAFDITMDPANDLPTMSSCTTCTFDEDFSNYWTAVMYFRHHNGTFKRVPQMAGQFLDGNGGMTVYYIQPYDGSKVQQFKKGFRMIVGDAMTRSYNSSSPEARSLTFRCFDENFGGYNGAPGTGSDTPDFPKKFCPGGIRSNIFFPTCWDGKNLDSPDHKSHVAYPNGAFESNSPCPASHPVKIPQVFLEIVWDTRGFKDIWPKDGSQPLVFSMGDPTGYGQHADYVFGWKGDALQKAMDQCTSHGGPCAPLSTQSTEAINRCVQSRRVDEPVDGWLKALPGCNSVKPGPGRATVDPDCGATTTYLPGGPQSAPGGGSPTVSPPTTGGSPPATGGGATPPFQGGNPPATGGGSAPPATGGATVAHYGQCGGNGYTGSTTCASPYTCKKQNDWYSQCL